MIRILALMFLVLSFDLTFAQSARELEREIEQVLRDKYNYDDRGFSNPLRYIGVKDDEYIAGLIKFRDALSKTKFVRNFRDVRSLYIFSEKSLDTF